MKKLYLSILLLFIKTATAQTENDAIMMNKNLFCVGAVFSHSSWTNYWEGTFKRDNPNLGTVSTTMIGLMGNYGLTNKINLIFNVPYVQTNASAGTMRGESGIQDLSFTAKYNFLEKNFGTNSFSLYTMAGFSVPLTSYTADYLPLSIGLRSKTATLRLMADLQHGNFFGTASTSYTKRDNIMIDRNSYFTTRMHYTSEVDMPDAIGSNFRAGYRTQWIIAEAVYETWVTQKGGFDITKNNMPFPSNTMNMARLGINAKYVFKKMPMLSLIGGANSVTSGRNVGQATTFYGGAFYIIDFNNAKNEIKNEK